MKPGHSKIAILLAGSIAGAINGLLGAGGGMLLVPLLGRFSNLEDDEVFPGATCMMLPMCLVSLAFLSTQRQLPFLQALPYLIGSCAGGLLAGQLGHKIPTAWLHRIFGILLLWGGIRSLW